MSLVAPPLTFNDLLKRSGLDEADVLVFRHRPAEPSINAILPQLVAERPELFDCYQSVHAARTEAALARARYLAAFIRYEPKTALFVGLYKMAAANSISSEACMARPLHHELMTLE